MVTTVKVKKNVSMQGRGTYAISSSIGGSPISFRTKEAADKFLAHRKKVVKNMKLDKKNNAERTKFLRTAKVVKLTR